MIISLVFLVAWWFVWLFPVRNYARWKRFIYYSGITLLLLYAGIVTLGVYYDHRYPWCQVVQETAIFVGPDTTYAMRGMVQEGASVRLMQRCGAWRKIQQGGLVGWVAADAMNE